MVAQSKPPIAMNTAIRKSFAIIITGTVAIEEKRTQY
jgi:hypothetical protein